MYSFASIVTESAFAENDLPFFTITGLSGFTATSTSGAKFTLKPSPARLEAIDSALNFTESRFFALPEAAAVIDFGKPYFSFKRFTRPPSWSIVISNGIGAAFWYVHRTFFRSEERR